MPTVMKHSSRLRRLAALASAATAATLVLLAAVAPAQAAVEGSTNAAVELPTADNFTQPTVLLAASGAMTAGLAVESPTAVPKHFWVNGFSDASQSVTWTVQASEPTTYRISLLANAQQGTTVGLRTAAGAEVEIEIPTNGWSRTDAGEVVLPAGETELSLAKLSGEMNQVKAVELVPSDAWASYQTRIAEFKAASAENRVRLSESGLGLMFQYGPWSYPEAGENPGIEEHTDAFDVQAFADAVEATGAEHIIWSISWWTYSFQAPIAAVDEVTGNGNRTATRDLIGELADEFQKRDIMFFLYYHIGQDEHLGYESTDFWQNQEFPREFTSSGLGDRTVVLDNWKKIIGEIGARYGDKLDGWFFDDGLVYYPADFEELGNIARTGNPQRLVSWNAWIVADYTQFQDVAFGEEGCGPRTPEGSPEDGGDGVIVSGKDAGLLQHCMERMEQDWGVNGANQTINTHQTAAGLEGSVRARLARNTAVSLNLMMHFPGLPSPKSLEEVTKLGHLEPLGVPGAGDLNDSDPRIAYTGNWGYASGRSGAGDYLEDVSYTRTDGDSFEVTFEGTGIDVFGALEGAVQADVSIDGVKLNPIDLPAASRYTPQALFTSVRELPKGKHTLSVTRTGGGEYFQLDRLHIVDEAIAVGTPADAAIALSAGRVAPKGVQRVTGVSFLPDSEVTLRINDERPGVSAVTDGAGVFVATVPFEQLSAGVHTMTATAVDGAVRVARFEVGAAPAVSLNAAKTVAGGRVTATLTGFSAESSVELRLEPGDMGLGKVTVDKQGAGNKEINVPAKLPAGKYEVVARDAEGNESSVRLLVASAVGVTEGTNGGHTAEPPVGGPQAASPGQQAGLAASGASGPLGLAVFAVLLLGAAGALMYRRGSTSA